MKKKTKTKPTEQDWLLFRDIATKLASKITKAEAYQDDLIQDAIIQAVEGWKTFNPDKGTKEQYFSMIIWRAIKRKMTKYQPDFKNLKPKGKKW